MMLQAPNFLRPWQNVYRSEPVGCSAVLLLFFLLSIAFVLYTIVPFLGIAFVSLFIFLLGIFKIEYLFYALIAVSFFHGWEVDFGAYNFTRSLPFLNTVNAPVADFLAIFLLITLVVSWLMGINKINFSKLKRVWPVFLAYAVFILLAFISSKFAYGGLVIESTAYLLRPLVFVAIVYLILPILLIKDKKTFMNVLYLWFGVGLLVALYGFASLFLDGGLGWTRVHPFAIFGGFTPLGINHNLLAEPLVMIIPIGVYLWYQEKKNWIAFATVFMLLIALGTLSRAAWLSLIVSFLSFIYLYRSKIKKLLPKNILSIGLIVLIILIPVIWYMSIFLTSNTVKSSNDSRLEMSRIAFFYTMERPLLGHGPGTFIYLLADTEIFRIEYGDPLDSHGIIQKLLIEVGILGLLTFAIFLYLILRYIWQAMQTVEKEENKYLLTALFIMILGSLTFQFFNTSYFKAVLWLPLGISLTTTVFYLDYVKRKQKQ